MRIMGLDVGEKTIGVAVSDPLGCIAQGIKTVIRVGSELEDIKNIKELTRQYDIELIVVGLPRNMNGALGEQGNKIIKFVEKLRNSLNIHIETWDERLTTVAAEKMLLSANVSRAKRKKVIDKLAAVIILQNYLDSRYNFPIT
ncbi:MAG TPA: Holliday junction resolvase RuvX [Desulfotomaculum sp.]|nr:Holliday junction resolvase RuvX [Desulfotomaculum sp.]HBY04961.1 Holliday junction resolvase RuvX [Desulfotomaculum sp.]